MQMWKGVVRGVEEFARQRSFSPMTEYFKKEGNSECPETRRVERGTKAIPFGQPIGRLW